ncbi:agmatinase [Gracilimonas sp. Q87]|uniref:agmatinase n=1 Tax=Gracilimonas sp. Q87 TaxID=3384766 RepID=UPI003983F2AD
MTKKTPIYAGIDGKHNEFDNASVLLQSIPYDGTSTWGKGADEGFEAFLDASENMEIYDIETDSEAYKKGVHILEPLLEDSSPKAVFEEVYNQTRELLKTEKFLTFFGGEHSVSIGIIKAFYEAHPDLTVLQLDAHADLRPEFHGSPYNHACAVHDASQNANLIQVGIRSMDSVELPYLDRNRCYFAENMYGQTDWMDDSVSKMTDKVYITLDLDVFDPSIMPATGTPEPGGILWNPMISYLKKVFNQKEVVGFDIVELAPIDNFTAPQFLTAKLYYKMLSYKFANS